MCFGVTQPLKGHSNINNIWGIVRLEFLVVSYRTMTMYTCMHAFVLGDTTRRFVQWEYDGKDDDTMRL